MNAEQDFQELIAQVRAHLEYRRALGVSFIETVTSESSREIMPARAPVRPVSTGVPVTEQRRDAPLNGLDGVRAEIGECGRCKLHAGRRNIVFGEGSEGAALVFVGEGPGQEEDEQGRPFVGAAGQLLTDIIVKGMKLRREDVYICNIVKCRPPDNRNPEPDEIEACIGFVKKQIAAIRPRVIVTLGNVPTQSLLGTKQGITKIRGIWHEYQGIPVMPTFHPSYLLRSPGEKKWVWEDIKLVMGKLGMKISEK